jgi:sugar phosphate isomerase/epimerase
MKLSVSTLGCPEWTLEEILERAASYGYDGIELRGIGANLDLHDAPGFTTKADRQTRRSQIADAGLAVAAVDSSVQLTPSDPEARMRNLYLGRVTIDLAQDLGAPFVRVFGGGIPEGEERASAVVRAADALRQLADYAQEQGDVTVVLETHDAFSKGSEVAELLALVPHPRAAALWDLHHPFRQGEAPEETNRLIGAQTRFVHVKDSQPGGTYCLPGEGDIPLRTMIDLLRASDYDGWLSLEWEKRWIPALLPPEEAFPAYAKALRMWGGGAEL